MGQAGSMQSTQTTQRIRPTPGTSGRRNRRGILSIYCENSHAIYNLNYRPDMTIKDIKNLLPFKDCQLKTAEMELENTATIGSLGIDNKSLVKLVLGEKKSPVSTSTADSLVEETQKIIGPKKKTLEKLEKPYQESLSILADDVGEVLDLKMYAVPDLKLEKRYKISRKKPLH